MENENKYQNGKIYKIVDNTNNNIYIGSTTQALSRRLSEHRKDYKRYLNNKIDRSTTLFGIIKNGDYDIFLIEKFPCNDKEEFHKRERYFIESLRCVNKAVKAPGVYIHPCR